MANVVCKIFVVELLLILLMKYCSSQNFKVKTKDLEVNMGGTLHLKQQDLIIDADSLYGCKVEVIETQPMFQRVGFLQPKLFDCNFEPGVVSYVHKGSPLLQQDQVLLEVYTFTANATFRKSVTLDIIISTDTYKTVTQKLPLPVDKLLGVSHKINKDILEFKIPPNLPCRVWYSSTFRLPAYGQIVNSSDRTTQEQFSLDCHELLSLNFQYENLAKVTPNEDFILLFFVIISGNDEVTENVQLRVNIVNAHPNSPPKTSDSCTLRVDVDQFILTSITSISLSVSDEETALGDIVFNVTKPLKQDQGYIVNLRDHSTPISSFKQSDVQKNLIAYQPPSTASGTKQIFKMKLKAFDSYFEETPEFQLEIVMLLEYLVADGLRNGVLLLDGNPAIYFEVKDIQDGKIKYVHDDSNSLEDFVKFRIFDGDSEMLFKFPVKVIPKDDSPPNLIRNNEIVVDNGNNVRIDSKDIWAFDPDSEEKQITYTIMTRPSKGRIMKRRLGKGDWKEVDKFTQKEIKAGNIYYQHSSKKAAGDSDSFEIELSDYADPPNKSKLYKVDLNIKYTEKKTLKCNNKCLNTISVAENDIGVISEKILSYSVDGCQDEHTVYQIVQSPVLPSTFNKEIDAGKFVSKDASFGIHYKNVSSLKSFSQKQINHFKLAYMPPYKEIGPRELVFIIKFLVNSCNVTTTGTLKIRIKPVNDKTPDIHRKQLKVREGGAIKISSEEISISDLDTEMADIRITLCKIPIHGRLIANGIQLNFSDAVNLENDTSSSMMEYVSLYVHNGGENKKDGFDICADDGLQTTRRTIEVDIIPINDEIPRLKQPLLNHTSIKEHQYFTIDKEMLNAQDSDTDNKYIAFHVIETPKFGQVQMNGKTVSVFLLDDVLKNKVSYRHTSGEIGPKAITDVLHFLIYDHPELPSGTRGRSKLPRHDIRVIIHPIDNSPMRVQIRRRLTVDEGGKALISRRNIIIEDIDTPDGDIRLVIKSKPRMGFIENAGMLEGSERSGIGIPITDFRSKDISQKLIYYVQSKHRLIEPKFDSVKLLIISGNDRDAAEEVTLKIRITPVNDEVPQIISPTVITVAERRHITLRHFVVNDADVPADEIFVTVSAQPSYGHVVQVSNSKPLNKILYDHFKWNAAYRHDGSENFNDSFTLTVNDGLHVVNFTMNVKIRPLNDEIPRIIKNVGLLSVPSGRWKLINEDVLMSIDDDVQLGNYLVYYLIHFPSYGKIQRRYNTSSEQWTETKKFTQKDVSTDLIRYKHNGMPSKASDQFSFYVTDGTLSTGINTFKISIVIKKLLQLYLHIGPQPNVTAVTNRITEKEGRFYLRVLPKSNRPPYLEEVVPLVAKVDGSAVISKQNLDGLDSDTSPEFLTYIISKHPMYGMLLRKGLSDGKSVGHLKIGKIKQISTISYRYNSGELNPKQMFASRDVAVFDILIEVSDPMKKENVYIRNPVDLYRFKDNSQGFKLTNHHLKVVNYDGSTKSNAVYRISKRPQYVSVQNSERSNYPVFKFTQEDIDKKRINIVVPNPLKNTHFDRFTFQVEDISRRFIGYGEIVVQWASIHFELSRIDVCRATTRLLSMKVKRIGQGDVTSFVRIRAESLSAKENEDFVPSRANQLQFSPGQTTALWKVKIIGDSSVESNIETLRVKLFNPVNAVLTSVNTTATIHIHNGKCDLPSEIKVPSKISRQANVDSIVFTPDGTVYKSNTFSNYGGKKPPETIASTTSQPIMTMATQQLKTTMVLITSLEMTKAHRSTRSTTTTTKERTPRPTKATTQVKVSVKETATTIQKKKSCRKGWKRHDKWCHILVKKSLNRQKAESRCRSQQSHLVVVSSFTHNQWLRTFSPKKTFWIGLTREKKAEKWTNHKISDSGYRNWRSKRPTELTRGKCTVILPRRGHWVSKSCSTGKFQSVCSYEL
ncbi:FRAS1-related extracellular matrix protein 1 [Nymphon striatum]|nr:FRAS1-related extracellular matrix protein 1 [Nymphon striatum]